MYPKYSIIRSWMFCMFVHSRDLESSDDAIRLQAVISIGTLGVRRNSTVKLLIEMLEIDQSDYIKVHVSTTSIHQSQQTLTSRDRPKSARRLRLNNSKSTSKCQVFSSTVPE